MREIDKKASKGKAAKTINFDKIVLRKLEERSKKLGVPVSKIVNAHCRRFVMTDDAYFTEMSKYHYLKFQEYQFLKNRAVELKEVKEHIS